MSKNCCGCKRVDLEECEVDEVTNIGAGTGLVFYTTSTGGNEIKSLTSNDGTVIITTSVGGDEVDLSVGPPGGVNIYNSDGTFTADRTVSNGGFDFNYQGTGTGIFNIQNNDDAALVSQSQLNLGSGGGGTLNLYGGSSNIIRMFNIQNIATSDVLYYNSGTGLVSYGATPGGGVPDEGFAVQWLNTNINTTTGTITINPATTGGWTQTVNFNSGMYNAGTGQFTFPSTGRYSYSMQISFSSNIPAQNYLSFVQVTLPGYGIFPFIAAATGPYWRTQVLPPTLRINESIGTSGIVEFPIGTASTVDLTYSNVSTAATNPSSILVAITVHRIY